jgi:hypothetical protein
MLAVGLHILFCAIVESVSMPEARFLTAILAILARVRRLLIMRPRRPLI